LSAALAPEKLVPFIPEEETNASQVFAYLNDIELLQTNHQTKKRALKRLFRRPA
jgi:hypothetical protein